MAPYVLASLLLPIFEETPKEEGGPNMLFLFAAIAAIFYFVMILPEKKNRKKREALMSALAKGDKIMMKSGLYGSVAQVQDDIVTVQIADGVRVKFSREAIQGLVDESEGSGDKGDKDEKAKD